MGQFSPDRGELFGIRTGLTGWKEVDGLGPDYFLAPPDEQALLDFVFGILGDTTALSLALADKRARVVNFFDLLAGESDYLPLLPASFAAETAVFLKQLKQQVNIWRTGAFKSLDFSRQERLLLAHVSAKANPVLFMMGFADAIPHSSQVGRLCASMAQQLGARPSEVFQAAVVGKLHDPKYEGRLDLGRQNLATHPVVAAALAGLVFDDPRIRGELRKYFHGVEARAVDFVDGLVDVLGLNDDSWFVQIMVVLPTYIKRISAKYGAAVAAGFKSVMEGRLKSAASGDPLPDLPPHLHGCLSQEMMDSGLRGISKHAWQQAVTDAGITGVDAVELFNQLVGGELGTVTQAQVADIRKALRANADAVLTAKICATRLLHHHKEVVPSGRIAGSALVIADPMMLSPHKIFVVYETSVMARLRTYCDSFDDNIRLLPACADDTGPPWQRAVYLSMLLACDKVMGTTLVAHFEKSHATTDTKTDIADLKALILDAANWGTYATLSGKTSQVPDVGRVLEALEFGYVTVVDQFRQAIYDEVGNLEKFYPKV